MTQKIISQVPMNTAQLKAELDKIKKRDEELGFRAQKTVDYLEQLGVMDVKKADKLYKALEALEVPRLRDVHFHKLIDTLPLTPKDVKVALQGYSVTISQENLKKLADTIGTNA